MKYQVYAEHGNVHSNNREDGLTTTDGQLIGPADLSPAFVSSNFARHRLDRRALHHRRGRQPDADGVRVGRGNRRRRPRLRLGRQRRRHRRRHRRRRDAVRDHAEGAGPRRRPRRRDDPADRERRVEVRGLAHHARRHQRRPGRDAGRPARRGRRVRRRADLDLGDFVRPRPVRRPVLRLERQRHARRRHDARLQLHPRRRRHLHHHRHRYRRRRRRRDGHPVVVVTVEPETVGPCRGAARPGVSRKARTVRVGHQVRGRHHLRQVGVENRRHRGRARRWARSATSTA